MHKLISFKLEVGVGIVDARLIHQKKIKMELILLCFTWWSRTYLQQSKKLKELENLPRGYQFRMGCWLGDTQVRNQFLFKACACNFWTWIKFQFQRQFNGVIILFHLSESFHVERVRGVKCARVPKIRL